MANSTYNIPEAIEVFINGFCHSKSQTYPYQAELYHDKKLGSIWIMQDTPTRKGARKAEIVSYGNAPERAIELVRQSAVGWHFLCDIHSPDTDFASIRSGYKALGYRQIGVLQMFCPVK